MTATGHLPHLGGVLHHVTGKEVLAAAAALAGLWLWTRHRRARTAAPPARRRAGGLVAFAALAIAGLAIWKTHPQVVQAAASRITVHAPAPSPAPAVHHAATAAASHPALSGWQIVALILGAAALAIPVALRPGRRGDS